MNISSYLDGIRQAYIDSDNSPTREIIYIPSSSGDELTKQAFIYSINNNTEDNENIVNNITIKGLYLDEKPTKLDKIKYDGAEYSVRTWFKSGETYSVTADNRNNKITVRRKF